MNEKKDGLPPTEREKNIEKVKTTCAIILNTKMEVLLIKRGKKPFQDYWALPAGVGYSKKGFPPDIAVCEEVSSDLGTKSFKGKNIFSIPVENSDKTDEVVVYVGSINESEIVLQPGFSKEFKWLSLKKAISEALAFEHTEILKKYLAFLAS